MSRARLVVILLALLGLMGLVGKMDADAEEAGAAHYCERVRAGDWPAFKGGNCER